MALGRCSRLCFLLLTTALGLSAGLEWHTEDFLHVTGCLGSTATLGWAYVPQPGEIVETIFWTKQRDSEQATIASYYRESFLPKGSTADRVLRSSRWNAGLDISTVQLSDTGYYGVQVTVMTQADQGSWVSQTLTASALLTIVEAPSLLDEALVAQEVTSDDTCAFDRHVKLRCGHFLSRGNPPVNVVWTDPAGQRLPSSRFSQHDFDLDLPRRPVPGNYTCRVTCQSPVLPCLPPHSPLLGSPSVHVQTEGRSECGRMGFTEEEREEEEVVTAEGQAVVDNFRENVTQLQDELADVKDELADVKDELADVKNELTEVKDELVEVKDELAEVKDELVDVKDNHTEEVAELLAKLLDELSVMKDNHTREVAELQSKLFVSEARLDAMTSTQASLASVVENLKDDLKNQMTEEFVSKDELEEMKDNHTQGMTYLQTRLQMSEVKLDEMARTQATLTSEMEKLKDDLRNRTTEAAREEFVSMDDLTAIKGNYTRDMMELQANYTRDIVQLQAKLQMREAELEGMTARIQASMTSEMDKLKDDIRNQTEEAVRVEFVSKADLADTEGRHTQTAAELEAALRRTEARLGVMIAQARASLASEIKEMKDDLDLINQTNVAAREATVPGGLTNSVASGQTQTTPPPLPAADVLRLTGSRLPGDGRVEVEVNGQWMPVCSDNWTLNNTKVVCRQLGFQVNPSRVQTLYLPGSGPVATSDIRCDGQESHLALCSSPGFDASYVCGNDSHIGVRCEPYDVRLREGTMYSEGRVEVFVSGQWRGICSRHWTHESSAVVCRQLRFSGSSVANVQTMYYSGTGLAMSNVRCDGHESRLEQCTFPGYNSSHECGDDFHVGVRCSTRHPIRLVNGGNVTRGRLEVYNGRWGTVCDDDFSSTTATIVCRQLGFKSHTGTVHGQARFGRGSGTILMDDVQCTGMESKITDCPFRGFGSHNCGHDEDVGVSCHPAHG